MMTMAIIRQHEEAIRRPGVAMPKSIAGAMLAITLDPSSDVPLFQQLYNRIRDGILGGRIPSGARLPASRTLAADLGVSRTTILNAFDQLVAEGYLHGRVGSGTRVVSTLPDTRMVAAPSRVLPKHSSTLDTALSDRIRRRWPLTLPAEAPPALPLRPGNPDLAAFPRDVWSRLTSKHWRNASRSLFGYGDAMGYEPLRSAIAEYVKRIRGVRCDSKHVLVLSGSQQALHLCAQVLLNEGDFAAMEDPGYPGVRAAVLSAGAHIIPTPVDQEGLVVAALKKRRLRPPKLIYVTPSHQCPLGMAMSLSRRLELIEFAHRVNAWIVEDDYDSEYRYFSRPVAALQSLDTNGRVIYVGTVSKTLIPALRIGYMVLPPPFLDAFARARVAMDRQPAAIDQAVLADFISEGWLERHIRQTRMRYMERQECLIEAIHEDMPDQLDASPAGAGMYLVAFLQKGISSGSVARVAETHGVGLVPLSLFSIKPLERDGLILGYGAYSVGQIRAAVKRLSRALREAGSTTVNR